MISKIEHLHESARNADTPLAPMPLIYFLNDADRHLNRLKVDTLAIREYMEPQVGGDLYKHMFIGLVPKDEMDYYGSVDDTPFEFESHTYFPKILLRVDTKKTPNIRKLNNTLRHELAHTLQPNNIAPYNSPKTVMQARGIGSALLAAGAALGNSYMQSASEIGAIDAGMGAAGLGAIGIVGAAALATPKGLLQTIGARELQANLYAFKHGDFTPITYS